MSPKISVITPSYNQGRYIKDTIESVLAQRYDNFEHIVIDGGSTDATVEILKKYPHINWVSEKDEGQSDALNKALAKATGDIIAWINSDDWYAEGAFEAAVKALEDYPVVMGGCAVVNDDGTLQYEVPNIERTWFDLLRYWVPYSIPTQPAIFFRRDALHGLEGSTGQVFDKELYYTMDYDLWTRLAIRTPFVKRVDQRFAYYRMTETNKTGDAQGGLAFAEPEMARIFKRAETIGLSPTVTFSILLPVSDLSDATKRTIESVLLQNLQDFELIVVGQNLSAAAQKELKSYVREKNAEQNKIRNDSYLRLTSCSGTNPILAINQGLELSEGRHVVALTAGSLLGSTFLSDALLALANNKLGLVLPWKHNHELFQTFVPAGTKTGGMIDFELSKIFESPALPLVFIVRRIALLECGDLLRAESPQKVLRELVAFMLFKGWHAAIQKDIRVTTAPAPEDDVQYLKSSQQEMTAQLILDLDTAFKEEPFAQVRAQHGCALVFESGIVESCKNLLKSTAD